MMTTVAGTGTTTTGSTAKSSGSSTASTSSTSSDSKGSASGIATTQAWTTFLAMLTTQLKNQNPLDPTKPDQFTQELIGLSQLEQQLDTNTQLSSVKSALGDISASNGLGYIGSKVTAAGSTAPLQNDSASWDYTLSGTADKVSLVINNSSGQTVWSGTGDTASGSHSLTWDGKSSAGVQEPDGAYTLVVKATDAKGTAVKTSSTISGTVTGVDSSSGTAELTLGSVTIPMSSVTAVDKAATTTTASN